MPEVSRKNTIVIQQVTERHLSTSITSITLPNKWYLPIFLPFALPDCQQFILQIYIINF